MTDPGKTARASMLVWRGADAASAAPKGGACWRRRSCIASALLVAFTPILASPAFAVDPAVVAGLRKLDPGTRLEQRCDIEAMARIEKESKTYKPERVVAGATADTKVQGNSLQGPGAAFRSKGKWYRLSFSCTTSPDRMDVLSFDYAIGSAIPQSDWDKYELWN